MKSSACCSMVTRTGIGWVLPIAVLALACLAAPDTLRAADHYKCDIENNSGTNANDLHLNFFGPYSNLTVRAFVRTNLYVSSNSLFAGWVFTNGFITNGGTTTIEWDAPSKDSIPDFGYWTLNGEFLTTIDGEVSFNFQQNSNQTFTVAMVNLDTNAHVYSDLQLYTGVPEAGYDTENFDNPAGGQTVPAAAFGTIPAGGSEPVATYTPASAGYNLVSASVDGAIYYTAFAFQPYLQLISPRISSDQFVVDLECPPSPSGYAVLLFSPDLTNWQPVATSPVTNGYTEFMQTLGTEPAGFYSVQLSW